MTPGRTGDQQRQPIDEDVLLSALTDDRCRAILSALTGERRTASELLDTLEIPCSTLYRKIETLVDGGLLEKQTRVRLDGNNETEYTCRVDELSLEVAFGDGVQIDVAEHGQDTSAERPAASAVHGD